MEVNILGLSVEVINDDARLVPNDAGEYLNKIIYMRTEYESQEMLDCTIVHEMFHALCDRLGIQLDFNLEEILAESMGNIVSENFTLKIRKDV